MMSFLAYLGHGRALELYLGCLKLVIGATILLTELDKHSPALADIAWHHPSIVIAGPFFLIAVLQLVGWVLNIIGVEHNWIWRAAGAGLAIFLWSTLLLKSGLVGDATFATPLAIINLPASSFLLWRAWNRFPVPGALGKR